MHTLEIPSREMTIEIPGTWDEMSQAQRTYCLKTAIQFTDGQIGYEAFLVRCFFKLANIHRSWRTVLWEKAVGPDKVAEKNANIIIYAEQVVTGIFKDLRADVLEIDYDTEQMPFIEVKLRKWFKSKNFILPDVLLQNITFGEFRSAVQEMNLFFESKEEEDLNRFCAVLLRPGRKHLKKLQQQADFDGQLREPFNPHRVNINARYVSKMKAWRKKAVLLWFSTTINLIQEAEELSVNDRVISLRELFPKPAEGEKATNDKSAAGWKGVLNHIATEGIFGTAKETDQQNLWDVLEWMYDQHEEAKRLKRKLK